jgi:serine/threonine-protein phosphatase 6 regulatory ankyrin repeat subunit B
LLIDVDLLLFLTEKIEGNMRRIFVMMFSCLLFSFGLAVFGQEVKEINPAIKTALVRQINPKISLDEIKKLVEQGADVNAKDAAGQTFLHNLVMRRSDDLVDKIKYLIEQKIDIDAKNNLGNTPLHLAAFPPHGSLEVVKLLVENGADVNAKNHDEQTPLYAAAQMTQQKEIVKYLIDKGADLLAADKFGRTPSFIMSLNKADNDLVKLLTNKENINYVDISGRTILNNFIRNNQTCETIEFICKECDADTNQIDLQGRTPLHYAATKIDGHNKKNRLETIKILLKHNANVNAKDQQGLTPLAMVAENPICEDIILLFLQHGADVTFKNQKGIPFIQILLAKQTDVDLLKKIISENKIHIDESIIKNAPELLHIAAGQKDGLEKIKLLVQLGFKIDTRNKIEQTPLHVAASTQDKPEILEYLIENGADINAKDVLHNTPFACAVEHSLDTKEDLKVVEYLLKQKIDINTKNSGGATPLITALSKTFINGSNYSFEKLIKLVQLLLNNKADINAKNGVQYTALHFALVIDKMNIVDDQRQRKIALQEVIPKNKKECEEYLELIKLLVKNGADINAKNQVGLTPLELMVSFSHVDLWDYKIIRYMLEQGADCNTKNKDGFTLFHLIVRRRDTMDAEESAEFFKLLLDYGGETDWSKVRTITPITWALRMGGDFKVVKYFVDHGADVNAKDHQYKQSPLTKVINEFGRDSEKNARIVHYLVQNGADVNEDQYTQKLPYHPRPSHLCNLLRFYPDLYLVKLFIEKGADVRFKDQVEGGVLTYALQGNASKEVIEYLIKQGADINVKDIQGCQAIHNLSRASHVEILKLLLDLGADINAISRYAERPIHKTAESGSIEIVKAMIENGANVNVTDDTGRTPLMSLLYRRPNLDIIKLFIKHGNKAKDTDNSGKNALHYAAGSGSTDIDIWKFLVTENDIDINAKTLNGDNVLHIAAEFLISPHAPKVFKYLIDKGADINAINKRGDTPGQIALKDMSLDADVTSEQFRDIIALFKFDVSIRLADDRTLLHWVAIEGRSRNIIRVLLDAGIPINAKDKFGSTALHLAVLNKDPAAEKIMQSLLDNGADINATDIYNATPLHDAVTSNANLHIFEILLKNNANINAKDIHGLKPIDLLREELEPEKANLLKSKNIK